MEPSLSHVRPAAWRHPRELSAGDETRPPRRCSAQKCRENYRTGSECGRVPRPLPAAVWVGGGGQPGRPDLPWSLQPQGGPGPSGEVVLSEWRVFQLVCYHRQCTNYVHCYGTAVAWCLARSRCSVNTVEVNREVAHYPLWRAVAGDRDTWPQLSRGLSGLW